MRLVAVEFNQHSQACGLHDGAFQIESAGRIEIQRVRFGIQKPFTGRVQFLEDVLDKAKLRVRRCAAIVLPSTFKSNLAFGVLASDAPREIPPQCRVHRVVITARRIRPSRHPLLGNGIRREPIEVLRLRVKVRITRQNLPLAVDEDLLRQQLRRNSRLKNSVSVRSPIQVFEPATATDDRLLAPIILEDHRRVLRARISCGEHERCGQIVSAVAQENVAAILARRLLRALQRGEGCFQRAGIRVVAPWRNEIRPRDATARDEQCHRAGQSRCKQGFHGRKTVTDGCCC